MKYTCNNYNKIIYAYMKIYKNQKYFYNHNKSVSKI